MSDLVRYQPAATAPAISYADMEKMAAVIANSGLFGVKNPVQALALMLVAQSEGLHPATAARDYHVIQGRPSLKADAMLAKFQSAGGKVEWLAYTETRCEAVFSHPQGGKVTVAWTIEMAKAAGLTGKDVWKQFPRAMLRARLISEGIRTIYPAVLCGLYAPEEVADMAEVTGPAETTGPDIKPAQKPAQHPTPPVVPAWPELPALAEIKAKLAAMVTTAAVLEYWQSLRLDNGHPRFAEIRDVFSDARRRIEAAKAAPAPSQPTPPPYDTESAEFLLESMPTAAERDAWLRDEKARMKWADADPIYTALRNVADEMAKKEATPAKREPMNAAPGKAATRESLAAAGFDGKNSTPFDDDLEIIG